MCDRKFRELLKLAVEKLKEESVWQLLQTDEEYQQDSEEEGRAEGKFLQLELTEEERAVCMRLLDYRDKLDFEYGTYAYIAGLIDAFHIMAVLFPEEWNIERIKEILLLKEVHIK